MADLNNSLTKRTYKKSYSFSGNAVKDKLWAWIQEMQSDMNAANSDIVILKAASPGTTAQLQSDIIAAMPPLPDSSASTLAAWGSQHKANISNAAATASNAVTGHSNISVGLSNAVVVAGPTLQADPADSTFSSFVSTVVAEESNLYATLSNIVAETGPKQVSDNDASTFGNWASNVVADASNAYSGYSNINVTLSNLGFSLGDVMATKPSGSTFSDLLSQLIANHVAVSDAFTGTIPSDLTTVVSDLNLVEKSLSDVVAETGPKLQSDPAASTFGDWASTVVADESNLYAILSNVVATAGAKIDSDPSASTYVSFASSLVQNVSNTNTILSNVVATAGAKLDSDPSASTYVSFASSLVQHVSNTTAILSNIVATAGPKLDTDPAASTFASFMSQFVADYSDTMVDFTDNAKSNITVIEKRQSDVVAILGGVLATDPSASTLVAYMSTLGADANNASSNITVLEAAISDLREAVSLFEVKYASDAWANVSDIKVTFSDFVVLISNALVA